MPVTYPFLSSAPRRRSSLCNSITLDDSSGSESDEERAENDAVAPVSPPTRWRRSSALAGSYEEALLSGRTSESPSDPIAFQSKICIWDTRQKALKSHDRKEIRKIGPHNESSVLAAHISVPFDAVYYPHMASESRVPHYTGTINIDDYYSQKLASGALQRFVPGLRIPSCGILEIRLSNVDRKKFKSIWVHYDVSDLKEGSKVFIRQITHDESTGDMNETVQETKSRQLVDAVHLRILKVANKFYMYNGVRVVFSPTEVNLGSGTARAREVCQMFGPHTKVEHVLEQPRVDTAGHRKPVLQKGGHIEAVDGKHSTENQRSSACDNLSRVFEDSLIDEFNRKWRRQSDGKCSRHMR